MRGVPKRQRRSSRAAAGSESEPEDALVVLKRHLDRRFYSAALGFEIGAHDFRGTATTNALDHQADIAKVQEWLGHASITTTRIDDRRKTLPEDSSTLG